MVRADEVKDLRLRLGLSQERFAQRLGVSVQSVRRWEAGLTRPQPLVSSMMQELTTSVPPVAGLVPDLNATDLGQILKGLGHFFEVAAGQVIHDSGAASSALQAGRDPGYVYGIRMRFRADGKPVIEEFGNLAEGAARDRQGDIAEPVVDVLDEGDDLVVMAELPGAEEDQIEITISGDVIEIVAGGRRRSYRKRLRLPCEIDVGGGLAHSYLNGILEIRCPKANSGPAAV